MTESAEDRHKGPGEESSGSAVSDKVTRLVVELQSYAHLNEVDAHRAAFTALALANGWSKAKIGRYLGISRARVGQKVDKLRDYVSDQGPRVGTLRALIRRADAGRSKDTDRATMVQFTYETWRDLEFARRMCDMLDR